MQLNWQLLSKFPITFIHLQFVDKWKSVLGTGISETQYPVLCRKHHRSSRWKEKVTLMIKSHKKERTPFPERVVNESFTNFKREHRVCWQLAEPESPLLSKLLTNFFRHSWFSVNNILPIVVPLIHKIVEAWWILLKNCESWRWLE